MMKKLMLIVAIVAVAAVTANAAVIYSESFDGSGDLNGTTTTVGGGTWAASGDWNENGTVGDASTDKGNNDHAFLAFTPEAGNVYTLSATLTQPTSGSWLAIGFTETANTTGTDADPQDFWKNITDTETPWLLYRAGVGNVDTFTGTIPGHTLVDAGDHPGSANVSIVLNTEAAAWTAEWFVDGDSVRSEETLASNPTINYVGFGREKGAIGTIDDFSLTVVPEPATLALLGLGGFVLRRRRNS
jgi:hypothetical protein